MITTVAGNGTPGFSGDNGPATSAQLNYPSKASPWTPPATSTSRTMADNRIRKVSSGVITTVAGTDAWRYRARRRRRPGHQRPVVWSPSASPWTPLAISTSRTWQQPHPQGLERRDHHGGGNGTPLVLQRRQRPGHQRPVVSIPKASPWTPPATSTSRTRSTPRPQGLERGDHHRGGERDVRLHRRQRPGHQRPVTVPTASPWTPPATSTSPTLATSRIRKVSNGVITTVAGNGTAGFSGDNGPATSAQLNEPYRRRRGLRRQPVHRRLLQQPHPQGLERGDHHRGGERDCRLQRRQRPGHQRPVEQSQRSRRGLRRQPVHRRHGNNRVRKVSNGVITTVAGNGT